MCPNYEGILADSVPCRLPPISELLRYPRLRKNGLESTPARDSRDPNTFDLQVVKRPSVILSSARQGEITVSSTMLMLPRVV